MPSRRRPGSHNPKLLVKSIKNVLFVCVENSCRSQMAEAYANMFGQNVIKACSAGSRPSGSINPKAIKAMNAAGYDLSVHASKGLDAIPDVIYDYVVTMGCGDACPAVRAKKRVDWDIPDPKGLGTRKFAAVRDLISSRVRKLIESI